LKATLIVGIDIAPDPAIGLERYLGAFIEKGSARKNNIATDTSALSRSRSRYQKENTRQKQAAFEIHEPELHDHSLGKACAKRPRSVSIIVASDSFSNQYLPTKNLDLIMIFWKGIVFEALTKRSIRGFDVGFAPGSHAEKHWRLPRRLAG